MHTLELEINKELRSRLSSKNLPLYDMMSYHLGIGQDQKGIVPERQIGNILQMSVQAFGGDTDRTILVAAALELINGFCEIHDDVQSGRPGRNGKDAVWWVWGPAQAINAGDGMHSLARLVASRMGEYGFSQDQSFEVVRMLDDATLLACEGRYRDLEMQDQLAVSEDSYVRTAQEKVGALFGAAFSIAAFLTGMEERVITRLRETGSKLGEAFLINSDVMELWGNRGTDVSVDFLNKKKLYPVVVALGLADPGQKRKLGEIYFKRVLETEDLEKIRIILDELNIRDISMEASAQAAEMVNRDIKTYSLGGDEAESLISYLNRVVYG